jgi:hypothetical protein
MYDNPLDGNLSLDICLCETTLSAGTFFQMYVYI